MCVTLCIKKLVSRYTYETSPRRPPQAYNNDSNYVPHETYEMTTPITNVSDVSTMAGFFSEVSKTSFARDIVLTQQLDLD
jgi:hypothetical protein